MIEFEMKFKHSHDHIKSVLKEKGAKYLKSDFNNDTYLIHPVKDYSETDEALRIRETSKYTKITYKGPKFDERSKTREEIDLEVESSAILDMFDRLGFKIAGQVSKQRDTWELNGFTITLDTVNHLGDYVEIESIAIDNSTYEEDLQRLHEFVQTLDINPEDQILTSYLELVKDAISDDQ